MEAVSEKVIYKTNNLDYSTSIEEPYGFIYITTNLVDGKRYIGQKKFDNESRWRTYLGSGQYLLKAIKKYGRENFVRDIVDIGFTIEELNRKENEWINSYNAVISDDYYNLIPGGDVVDSLRRKGSVPVVCVNNGMKFKSIKDASLWSGHTGITIKRTFDMKIDDGDDRLIFRPLIVEKGKRICLRCYDQFTRISSRRVCNKCLSAESKRKKKPRRINEHIKYNAVLDSRGEIVKVFEYKADVREWIRADVLSHDDIFMPHHYDRLVKSGKTLRGYKFIFIDKETYENNTKYNYNI